MLAEPSTAISFGIIVCRKVEQPARFQDLVLSSLNTDRQSRARRSSSAICPRSIESSRLRVSWCRLGFLAGRERRGQEVPTFRPRRGPARPRVLWRTASRVFLRERPPLDPPPCVPGRACVSSCGTPRPAVHHPGGCTAPWQPSLLAPKPRRRPDRRLRHALHRIHRPEVVLSGRHPYPRPFDTTHAC